MAVSWVFLNKKNDIRQTYSFGHANASILDGKSLCLLVGNDVDAEVLAGVELAWVGESFIANFV